LNLELCKKKEKEEKFVLPRTQTKILNEKYISIIKNKLAIEKIEMNEVQFFDRIEIQDKKIKKKQ
jgi:hypothetical protein